MRGRSRPRAIQAAGPRPDAGALRESYLDLLKLCLCDLAGRGTTSVEGLPGGGVAARELGPGELDVRVRGADWPMHGLTMGGLLRLDDLQARVETVVREGIEGDLIEVGTWRGGSSLLMRATLDALGESGRTVWLADSFQGFPAPAGEESGAPASEAYPDTVEPYLAAFDFLAVPAQEVRENFARFGCQAGIELVEGFFDDTLPGLRGREWSLVRLDADTYDSTMLALDCLYGGLAPGGFLVLDDYGALEECRVAVDRFREQGGIGAPLEWVDEICAVWRKAPDEPSAGEAKGPPREPAVRALRRNQPMPRAQLPIPSARELALVDELAALRAELNRAREELECGRDALAELEQMRASTSWRLTRPLRELRRARPR